MKKSLFVIPAFLLIARGATGHRTVADIALNHLIPKAKAAGAELSGTQTTAEMSITADWVRSEPAYRSAEYLSM